MAGIEGADDLARRFAALSSGQAGERILRQFGLLTVQIAKANARQFRKTGQLESSIRVKTVDVQAQRIDVVAGGTREVGYAVFMEKGTRPHPIVPVRKKVLFFPSQKATTERFGSRARLRFRLSGNLTNRSLAQYGSGAFVLTKRVQHPGTAPRPYLLPAAKDALTRVGLSDQLVTVWNESA